MSMLRYAVPALAAVGSAAAACSSSGTTTIQNAGDASALATCSTYSGDIAIATGTADAIAINSVQRIKGALTVIGAPNMTSIGADSLEQIDDELRLDNVQNLGTASFPQLTAVGKITFNALPNLAQLEMGSEIQQTGDLNIQNTGLQSLDGINLKQCNSFYLANNNFLQEVTLQLQNVSGAITIESSGDRVVVNFPNLESAENITFRNVPTIMIPSLANVNGSLGFIENEGLQNISCPNLTRVDGSLSVNTNNALKSISFPKLQTVKGAVNVENNTQLAAVEFPTLATVNGAFDAYGNFSKIDLPKLNSIKGAFNVQSGKDISSACDDFKNESGPDNVIKGDFQCAGEQANPSDAGSTPTGSGAQVSRTGSSADHMIPSTALTGVMGVLAAMLGML